MISWGTGRRLWDLSVGELLAWAYSRMVQNLDAKGRRNLDWALTPRRIMNNPAFPESMQGRPVPHWFNLEDDGVGDLVQLDVELAT